MNQRELEQGILAARDRGDQRTMQRLQERYRNEITTTRVSGPGSITLVGVGERSSVGAPEASAAKEISPPSGCVPRIVQISAEARGAIVNDGLAAADGSTEICGLLVGNQSELELHIATAYPGQSPSRGGWVGLPDRSFMEREWLVTQEQRARLCGMNVVADVHSHPRGDGRPSQQDQDGWRMLSEVFGVNWVGVICTPKGGRSIYENGWDGIDWHGWVVDDDNKVVPVLVEVDARHAG